MMLNIFGLLIVIFVTVRMAVKSLKTSPALCRVCKTNCYLSVFISFCYLR